MKDKIKKLLFSLKMADIEYSVIMEYPDLITGTLHKTSIIIPEKYNKMPEIFGLENENNIVTFKHECKAEFFIEPEVIVMAKDHIAFQRVSMKEFTKKFKDIPYDKMWNGRFYKSLNLKAFIKGDIVGLYETSSVECWQ